MFFDEISKVFVIYLVLQRGSDELLSQNGGVSNGGSISPQNHSDNNNDAKKVSHIRNLIKYINYEICSGSQSSMNYIEPVSERS